MPDERRIFGTRGEDIAAEFLCSKGMKLIDRQARTKHGEIDLVMFDNETVAFVEVKARRSKAFGYPEESITRSKAVSKVREKRSFFNNFFIESDM